MVFISQNPIWWTKCHIVCTFLPPQQDLSKTVPIRMFFKLILSQKSFYVFRKDRQCKFIFLLSPSLDLINIISVQALKAMKVASETLQRSGVIRQLPALIYNPEIPFNILIFWATTKRICLLFKIYIISHCKPT